MLQFKDINPLGATAIGLSYIRAKESLREDALFYDKLAVEIFKYKYKEETEKNSADDSYIIIRTKFFDDEITRILNNNDIEQVVVLGVGLDIRFYRLSFTKQLTVFQVDQKEVIQFRNEFIPRLNLQTLNNFVDIGITFSNKNSFSDELIKNNFNVRKKTLWVLEGLLYYLKQPEVEMLISEISQCSSQGSVILLDAINSSFLESPYTEKWITKMRAEGRGWYFGIDNYDDFLNHFGWHINITQPGEDCAAYGRWKYKVLPISMNHIPKYFFIEGTNLSK